MTLFGPENGRTTLHPQHICTDLFVMSSYPGPDGVEADWVDVRKA